MSADEFKIVTDDEVDIRLDRWFKRYFPDIGHSHLQKLLRTGQIRVDSKRVQGNKRLAAGQKIRIPPSVNSGEERPEKSQDVHAEDAEYIRSLVIYRDDWVVAINKPPGLAVQGGSGTSRHVDSMLGALQGIGGERLRLVHRLDKDTSGVLLLANSAASATHLGASFRSRVAVKLYWGVTVGVPSPIDGQIDLSLSKEKGRGGERVVAASPHGKRAATRYQVLETVGEKLALVALMPTTGRTHQLRVHMAAIGTPILGDGKYGGRASFVDELEIESQLHLHARRIAVPHPSGKGTLDLTADLPEHMANTFRHVGLDLASEDDPFGAYSSFEG